MSTIATMALVAAAVEGASSYALYRYFSIKNKDFHPTGSSTYLLLNDLALRARGEQRRVRFSSDQFPLFKPDERLGFSMNPGQYNIIEQYGERKHKFHMQVNERGNRAASYVPIRAAHRLFVTGDSYIFGLGVNDEQTVPWLLQGSMPNDEVVNLSLSSYSTLQALIQLRQTRPELGNDDTVVFFYHPLTNDLNVVAPDILDGLKNGYEVQLGDSMTMTGLRLPYAEIDANNALTVRYIALTCGVQKMDAQCRRDPVTADHAIQVTQRLFDEVANLHSGHLIVAVVSGADDDPVVVHLRQRGIVIADLRVADDEPDANDILPNDNHVGPFRQYAVFKRLLAVLTQENLVH